MPTYTNADLVRKAAGAIQTSDFIAASGLLAPEQSRAFLDQIYESTPFSKLIRTERRKAKSGAIAKIGIGGRLLRRKTAGVDDSTLVKAVFSDVSFQTVSSRLDWEVEEEVFQDNIEGEALDDHLVRLMTTALGIDLEDLHFNGDVADVSADAAFLTQNEGWLKQLAGGTAHRTNGATINGGSISKDHFFAAINSVPAKYQDPSKLRWIGNPVLFSRYAEYLTNRATPAGDSVLVSGKLAEVLGYQTVSCPKMPVTRLLLADPQNFIAVNTYDVRRRKTTEGREAIRQDKRFYAIFLDDDPIIEEQDGIADVYGLDA